jgi:hypothetical protein
MTLQRKPPIKGKRRGAGEHTVYLSDEQINALHQFQRDFGKAYPQIQQAQVAAQRIFQEMVNAPTWQIAEGQKPHYAPEPEPQEWKVGHAKVNYVDKIETRGEIPEPEGNSE